MGNQELKTVLYQHFYNLLDRDVLNYIKFLKQEHQISEDFLYLRLREKYPNFFTPLVQSRNKKSKLVAAKIIYKAAITYHKNITPMHLWQNW